MPKSLFERSDFPSTPGGDRYEWKDSETHFDVPKDGKYIISIAASAKNAAQNDSSDDDDLRVVIDGYEFGKQEVHQDKVSWKGFGVAASWDGASLQGGSKTVYFFMSLKAGEHTIQFWADETPALHSIRVSQVAENEDGAIEDVSFDFNEQAPGQKTNISGIPWKAFVFAPGFNVVKLADITAIAQSGKQKDSTDGDNIKVYINGQILQNPKAPTSDKYKNFFFSGDLSQGQKEALMIAGKELIINDQDVSIELWYDETPILERVQFELHGGSAYDQPNAFKELLKHIRELFGLPKNLRDNWKTIDQSASTSHEAARQYAEEHDFRQTDGNGRTWLIAEDNEPDALRHFMWNVILTRAIDAESAEVITTNHERFGMEIKNKKALSRADVMDLWNNKQGREFAEKYPEKEYIDLFKMAKSEGKLILRLEDVKEEHRKEAEDIINNQQP